MSGIRKGDYYSLRNNSEEALSYYLQVAEKLPNDLVVRKKIAHVYALQKNWKAAYENYVQVPILELSATEKSEMIQSLFFDA
jgi:tetratricopeptide (TPR) repeat protein